MLAVAAIASLSAGVSSSVESSMWTFAPDGYYGCCSSVVDSKSFAIEF